MMVSSPYYFVIAGALLLLLGQGAAGSNDVIDNEPLNDRSIVDQLCDRSMGQSKRISRISTIPKLHGCFDSLPVTNQDSCREFYLEPLNELRGLLEAGSEDVCSPEMMEKINKFHWHYIVGGLSQRWRKAPNGTLPEPLKMFFMNYATEVTEKCKDALLGRLTLAASHSDTLAESLYTNKFGLIINKMSDILQPQSNIRKHDDFLLIWDQLIDKEHRKGRSVEQKIDPATGETIYLSFKVKDPESVWFIQKKCRQELRPVYKQTVLPVMRFISMGYGNEEKHSREDVAGSELVKNWYAITQLCQLILPVNFYKDKSLKNEQATILSMEESSGLTESVNGLDVSSIPTASIQIKPIQMDDVLPNAKDDQIAKLVKSNLKARSHIHKRVMRNAIKMTNGQLKSKLKSLFISKKVGNNKYVVENSEAIIDRSITGRVDELMREDDVDNGIVESKHPGALVRNKRGFFSALYRFCAFTILLAVLIYLCYLLALAIIASVHAGR